MRKSILRFGALALMSAVSIGAWAQSLAVGDVFVDQYNNLYEVTVASGDREATLQNLQGGKSVTVDEVTTVTLDLTQKVVPTTGVQFQYKVTAVRSMASSGLTNDITVKLPSNIKSIGSSAFANSKVTIEFQYGILDGTDVKPYAFSGATIANQTLDFSKVTLPDHAFWNATFQDGTTIDMGNAETLPEGVFGVGNTPAKGDIKSIIFAYPGRLTEVCKDALKYRNITNFGYLESNDSYLLPKTLKTIGQSAFVGVSGLAKFAFSVADKEDPEVRISTIGPDAFNGCTWMTDAVFANVCKSFEGLDYDQGSFSGCRFEVIDLSKSNEKAAIWKIGDSYEYMLGVHARAFEENATLKRVILPEGCLGIGNSAFKNASSNLVVDLPEGLEYVGQYAFALATTPTSAQTEAIKLPKSLKVIHEHALDNRYLGTIYVAPPADNFDYAAIPLLETPQNNLTITDMQLPVVAPWTEVVDESSVNKTIKKGYEDNNWKTTTGTNPLNITLTYAHDFNTTGTFYYEDKGVKYQVDTNVNSDYGFFPATVVEYTGNTPEVQGMITTEKLFYEVTTQYGTEKRDAKLKGYLGEEESYPIILQVNGFKKQEGAIAVAKPTTENKSNITSITFGREPAENTLASKLVEKFPEALASAYSAIPANAFGTNVDEKLTSVTLAEGIATVGASAFKGTKITTITLPKTLTTIGDEAFATSSLKTVNVSYATVPNSGITTPFAKYADGDNAGRCIALLNVSDETEAATREAYRNATAWEPFFGGVETIQYKGVLTEDYKYVASDVAYNKDGILVDTYVLKDGVAEINVTADNASLNIRYDRNFAVANWQCWYVPFDFKFTDNTNYEFAELYDTQLNGEETVFEYRKVTPGEGVIIKANTPYVIKPKASGLLEFHANGIKKTPSSNPTFTVSNAKNTYTFTSIYKRKTATESDCKWYAINALSPGCFFTQVSFFEDSEDGESSYLNAYRFYMEIGVNSGNPYKSQDVKFVVLDEDEVTAIENVKANSLNAPMFDLQGRQIVAPAKGQVYIQNGVKKLAR